MAVASCYGHFLSAPSTLYPSSFESETDES